MAKIEDSKPKSHSGGYERVFGVAELGVLMTKIQSTVIRSGVELEQTLQELLEKAGRSITEANNLDELELPGNVYFVPKKVIKQSKLAGSQEPDFIVLVVKNRKRHCYIIELKDGDMFDTKKSAAELRNLQQFQNHISGKIPFTTSIHICCFNQEERGKIVKGLKGVINPSQAMTGRELCELLELDYDGIVTARTADQRANVEYFVKELLKIKEAREEIVRLLERDEPKS